MQPENKLRLRVDWGEWGPWSGEAAQPQGRDSGSHGAAGAGDPESPACLSSTKRTEVVLTPSESRKPRARTLQVIAETIRSLLEVNPESCLWVTVTFPKGAIGREIRQQRFDHWRKYVLEREGLSVWVPEPHQSGEIHYHGIWKIPGRDFATGFDHWSRANWVKHRSKSLLHLWKTSGSADLRWMWSRREGWSDRYKLGFVDIVPFRPCTVPIAVARYLASYASQGDHPKGTRLVRRIGWQREGIPLPIKSNEFSFCGERSRFFGACKIAGDDGPTWERLRSPKLCYGCKFSVGVGEKWDWYGWRRKKGWALRAAITGAGRLRLGYLPFPYLVAWECIRSWVRSWRKELDDDQVVAGVRDVIAGRFFQ
jgi:hypothetical protein